MGVRVGVGVIVGLGVAVGVQVGVWVFVGVKEAVTVGVFAGLSLGMAVGVGLACWEQLTTPNINIPRKRNAPVFFFFGKLSYLIVIALAVRFLFLMEVVGVLNMPTTST